jgi:glycosyltransferase involved in cell wall biosynthesis
MLTVLIATHNGAYTLPSAFEAYCQLRPPAGGWNCVVIDNASTDATKEIIHSFMNRLPLAYHFEPGIGKNSALNAGLSMAKGDLVVFTDDDTLPHPDWLAEMRRAADSNPSFSIFAGSVIPRWEIPPEPWITSWVQKGPVFTLTDPSQEDGPIRAYSVFGTNMAIRADVFQAGYRYNTSIGPRPGGYAMGSETELTLRLENAGFAAWYCKAAMVEHMIRKFQMERGWILRRATRYGRGKYRMEIQQQNADRKKLHGIPGYLLRELVKKGFGVGRAKLSGRPAELFERRWVFNYLLGQAMEARAIHRELQLARSEKLAKKGQRSCAG